MTRRSPEVGARYRSRKRRTNEKRGMTKEDKMISNAYRLAIAKDPCFYCGTDDPYEVYHVDHLVALARGGTNHWFNMVRACASCNLRKKTTCFVCFIGPDRCGYRWCRVPSDSPLVLSRWVSVVS